MSRRPCLLALVLALASVFAQGADLPRDYFREGWESLRVGDSQQAADKFRRGLELDPTNALATFYLGEAYFAMNDARKARAAYAKALDLGLPADSVALAQRRLTILSQETAAQGTWPARPLRLVVPFAAGGTVDMVARIVVEPLGRALGQSVVVDNRPGAGGAKGALEVVQSPPDGYTLLLSTPAATSIAPFLAGTAPYDPIRQLKHIGLVGVAPVAILASPKTGFSSLQELIKHSADQEIKYGIPGRGTLGHVVGEMIRTSTPIRLSPVEFRGTVPLGSALAVGTVPIAVDVASPYLKEIQSGEIRVLAVVSNVRSPLLPGAPTMNEQLGYAVPEVEAFYGFASPNALPRDVASRLAAALAEVAVQGGVTASLRNIAVVPKTLTSPEFTDAIAKQVTDFSAAVQRVSAKP